MCEKKGERYASGIPGGSRDFSQTPRQRSQEGVFLAQPGIALIQSTRHGSEVRGCLLMGLGIAGLIGMAPVLGEAVVEGRVTLPKSVAKPVTPPRYENVPPAAIGRPEPPVAVVYLEGPTNVPASRTNAVLTQKHLQFAQGLLPIQMGTGVEFPNLDNQYHSVFSYSKPKRFDLGRYTQGEHPPAQVFTQPGVIRLNCEIHQHMRATILVLETPYFVRTDTNGVFRLTGLPAGQYTLKAWVEERDVRSQPVTLTDGGTVTVNFGAKR